MVLISSDISSTLAGKITTYSGRCVRMRVGMRNKGSNRAKRSSLNE